MATARDSISSLSWPSGSPLHDVISYLRDSREGLFLQGCQQTALAYLLANVLRHVKRPLVVMAATDQEAQNIAAAISFFCGREKKPTPSPPGRDVWYLPSRTAHKAQALGKMTTTARRLEALYAIRTASSPILVVTTALAMLERIIPVDVFLKAVDYRVVGEELDLDAFCRQLIDTGYYRVSLVEEYGDLSRRGGLLDVYAPLYDWPLRLEFFGDQLESIRLFHPTHQRSLTTMEDAILLPASEIILDPEAKEHAQKAIYEDVQREWLTPAAGNVWLERLQEGHQLSAFEPVLSAFYDKLGTLCDYLDTGTILVFTDATRVRGEMEERFWQLSKEWEATRSPHEWSRPPVELFENPEELWGKLEAFQQVWVNPLEMSVSQRSSEVRSLDLGTQGQDDLVLTMKSHPHREHLLEPIANQFKEWQRQGLRAFLTCQYKEQAQRLVELLTNYGVQALFSEHPFAMESFDAAAVKVLVGPLEKGFLWPAEHLTVVCEEELFGKKRTRRKRKSSLSGVFLNSFQDLHVDDLIVHVDHGIGLYKGLVHLEVRDIHNDFLLLLYQDGDRLYLPVDKLNKVQKYLGIEGHQPHLDKLGGRSWETAKKKARESAQRIAEELLRLYAIRQVREGLRFSPPDSLYREFEATFAYQETPDQLHAIEDVLDDMTSSKPMDRLICGDVGYGKTEVALRAAFKAVMDGKQVAMLVPTTVLAEQHFQTFQERYSGFPTEVAVLSRFKTPAQQRKVLEGLQKGAIDVVIGTHRLLQKDVTFRDLGLLIIDEEHRFGVKHKEKLKQLRVAVDVLTLTATPIPRTLQMSLTGIRDLSTIETPPQDRHAIETYVCKYDEFTIREALYNEFRRGGQVFFVHNHVQSIYHTANLLGRLAPELRIAVAHGQMKERELEKVMLDFVNHQVDVLVCTTIIESGLDIPAANTIIVNRADKFGLAQIYQLRGRVGRAAEQAYAYLLIPGEYLISRDAQKRLRALLDFSELGAGFKIALNDLQIRGGGSILGAAQSGRIAAVGYELYLELLEKTVSELKGEKQEDAVDPEMNVPVSAFLPEAFVPDAEQRLLAYKRLATASEEAVVDELATEWRDRYGILPQTVRNLLLLKNIRLLLARLRIVRVDADQQGFLLRFAAPATLHAEELLNICAKRPQLLQLAPDYKLLVRVVGPEMGERLTKLRIVLQELLEHGTNKELI